MLKNKVQDMEKKLMTTWEYFESLGYKISNPNHYVYIVKDFQRHADIKADGLVGPITQGKMDFYNKDNFCPEVFEPILNNIEPIDCYSLEKYCLSRGLSGLSWAFMDGQYNHNVNVFHNIAHAILESASGTSFIARMKNNLYGFKAYDNSPYASAGKFKDYPDCINTWTKWWKKEYLLPTGKWYNSNSEQGVNVRYASSPIAGINKSFIVRDLRKKLHE